MRDDIGDVGQVCVALGVPLASLMSGPGAGRQRRVHRGGGGQVRGQVGWDACGPLARVTAWIPGHACVLLAMPWRCRVTWRHTRHWLAFLGPQRLFLVQNGIWGGMAPT